MRTLEEKILKEGKLLDGNVLKVGSFLNQRLDVEFLMSMGDEVARLFAGEKIDKVLTVEASGIPFAVCVAYKLGVPAVYAKKGGAQNVSGDVYTAEIYSFTHKKSNIVVVGKEYLQKDENILIADDFLANGAALNGLISIVKESGAKVAGCAIAIEKGFQHGGDNLRKAGYKVESLAIIDEIPGVIGLRLAEFFIFSGVIFITYKIFSALKGRRRKVNEETFSTCCNRSYRRCMLLRNDRL